MSDPGRLHAVAYHADGRSTRWGPGEQTDRLLNDVTFSTATPGGFKDATGSLLRDLIPQADEGLLDRIVLFGPGGRIVWEGRVQQLPRETGEGNRMQVVAVGYSAHLEDQRSFREIYVDRDLSRWGAPSLARRVANATAAHPELAADAGQGLVWAIPNEANPDEALGELFYDTGPGCRAAGIGYRGARSGTWTGFESPTLIGGDDADLSGSTETVALTLDDTVRLANLAGTRRYLVLRAYLSGGPQTPPAGTLQKYSEVAVYGDHGLTQRAITGHAGGFYASDIVANVVARAAPLLNTAGIQTNTTVIPQASFPDPTTAANVIAFVNGHVGWDWMVYDNRTFYYQQAGSGVEWRARRSDGARLRLDGTAADVIANMMFVRYTDEQGRPRIAGPVGSGCDVEDASLEDTSATNAVVMAGYTEKSEVLDLSQPVTDAAAITIGALALYEKNIATRRGQITLTGFVEHPTEGKVPVWRVRAGDTLIVGDMSGDVPRRIISTDYQHQSRTLTVAVDNTPAVLDALLERLAVSTAAFVG